MIKPQTNVAQIQPEPENESKADKFIRLAEARTRRAIKHIDFLGFLSNKTYYDYTPEQIETIFRALAEVQAKAHNKFMGIKEEKKVFSLSDGAQS